VERTPKAETQETSERTSRQGKLEMCEAEKAKTELQRTAGARAGLHHVIGYRLSAIDSEGRLPNCFAN